MTKYMQVIITFKVRWEQILQFGSKIFKGYRSFKYIGAKLWNLLPSHLKSIDDLHVLKSYLHRWCLTEKAHKILSQMGL